jgi:toxin YoeB
MVYALDYTPIAERTIEKYRKSNPMAYKKIARLLDDIVLHPRYGIGHPEPLIGGNDNIYSRRISGKDRIIYEIKDEVVIVTILTVGGHYDDK